ncbi:MAG: cation diffusion facilitator family transporter [Flavobacteriaceae bacterium]
MTKEYSALKYSIFAATIFAILGLIIGFISKSKIVLFDGVYSLMSLGLSLGASWIYKEVNAPLNDQFPLGKAHFEPLFVLVKNLVLVGICTVSIIDGISEFVHPSESPDTEMGLTYAVLSFIGCLIVYRNLSRRNIESDIMKTEVNQWRGDTYLSAGVLLGFVLMWFISDAYKGYIDAGMVIISGVLFLSFPYRSIKEATKELLLISYDNPLNSPVNNYVENIAKTYKAQSKIRRVKIGRTLLVEVNLQTQQNTITVDQMDEIRLEVKRLYQGVFEVWVNVNFTKLEDEI